MVQCGLKRAYEVRWKSAYECLFQRRVFVRVRLWKKEYLICYQCPRIPGQDHNSSIGLKKSLNRSPGLRCRYVAPHPTAAVPFPPAASSSHPAAGVNWMYFRCAYVTMTRPRSQRRRGGRGWSIATRRNA